MARELTYVPAHVRSLTRLGTSMRRLVLGGLDATSWQSSGVPDEAVLLVFPGADGLVLPDATAADGDPYQRSRWYTVRAHDPRRGELTVDLVDHPAGLSSRWALGARPGDPVGVSSVRSWWSRPASAGWQVLVGDLTALPTISRVLERHSDGLPTRAVIEMPDPADEQPLVAPACAEVSWVHTPAGTPSRLPAVVGSLHLPPGDGFVHVAGEAGATREVRRHLRHERGLPPGSYSVAGYWRARAEEWMRRYLEVEASLGLAELYERFEAPGADKEAINDEVDRRLAAAGL